MELPFYFAGMENKVEDRDGSPKVSDPARCTARFSQGKIRNSLASGVDLTKVGGCH